MLEAGADEKREQRRRTTGLVVGVTGGIGSGKSTVAALFVARGAGLVDTDAIAHELTGPGGQALHEIRRLFGPDYLTASGALDRARMRAQVFADPIAKRNLEQILHPLIRDEVYRRVQASAAPYVLVLIPLLVETGGYRDLLERVLVVDCDEQTQLAHAMERDGMGEAEVQAIMRAQASRDQRLAAADEVIDNNGSLEQLRRQVETLDARYRDLAQAR